MQEWRSAVLCLHKNGDLHARMEICYALFVQEWSLISKEWKLLCIAVQEWSLTVQCCARMEINKHRMEIIKQRMETAVHCCARMELNCAMLCKAKYNSMRSSHAKFSTMQSC